MRSETIRKAASAGGIFVAALVVALHATSVGADTYPTKPVRVVAPYSAGGTLDVVTRMIGAKLSETWGQPFIVDNRPGAGGNIGTELVARAKPDGYTLLMGNTSTHAINQSLYPKIPFDPVKDFAPITQTVTLKMALVVHQSVSAKSVPELIALAKASPDQLTVASGGIGTTQHLGAALFMHMTGTKMVHVPYKGNAPAIADLVSGQVKVMFDNLASVMPHVTSGQLRLLAVTSTQRSPMMPDIPAVAETPGLEGFELTGWHGLFAPSGTSPVIVKQLNAEIVRILQTAEMREQLSKQGVEPVGSTPEAFAAFQSKEASKWAEAVKASGARVD
jgi:tripartite-type tricarboxylate transporter receptor subunit TctC